MELAPYFPIVHNISLLLASVLLFNFLRPANGAEGSAFVKAKVGIGLGCIAMATMLTPWHHAPGIFFDVRSVLIGISGLFFGTLPTVMAMAMASALRLYQGGAGAPTGIAVIVASGLVGLAWRHLRRRPLAETSWGELYLFGLAVHAVMLGLMFTLPWETALRVVSRIAGPVLLLYPLGTALLGSLLIKRLLREHAAKELRASEELFRNLFEDHTAVKLLIDPENGDIVDANHAAAEYYGWSRDQLRSMRIQDINILSPEELERQMDLAKSAAKLFFEFRHRRADGSVRDVEVFSSRIRVKDRVLLHSIVHDTSERSRAETELRESEERYRSLFTAQLDAFVLHELVPDAEGRPANFRFLAVNPAFERLTGLKARDVVGRLVLDVYPNIGADHMGRYFDVASGKGATSFERFTPDLGLYVEISAYAPKLGQLAMLIRDVTERHRSAQQLALAKEAAEASNRAKGEFLANMSHELRTPLNGVLGMLQLLDGSPDISDENKVLLETAMESGRALLAIITDILSFAQLDAGKLAIAREPADLREIVDSIHRAFRFEAEDRGLALRFHVEDTVPGKVLTDAGRLRQIILNLLSNSLKFTEQGWIEINLHLLTSSPSPDTGLLLFTVSDTGIGIPEDRLDDIFEPFTQVDGSLTRKYQGTGIGLGIVRQLVRLMGGSICVESMAGRGTTFHVTVRCGLHSRAADEACSPVAERGRKAAGLRILVAEDDRVNMITTTRFLERLGCIVTMAGDGRQALSLLMAGDFNCVLMDVQMPLMDGVEATRAIRESSILGPKARIPIIAMTAHAMPGDRERFMEAGMDGYITKPVDLDELECTLAAFAPSRQ